MIFKNNKVYDILVWVSSVVLPALAVLYTALAEAWGLPYKEPIALTIMAIDAFLGAILKVSSIKYHNELEEEEGTEGTRYRD